MSAWTREDNYSPLAHRRESVVAVYRELRAVQARQQAAEAQTWRALMRREGVPDPIVDHVLEQIAALAGVRPAETVIRQELIAKGFGDAANRVLAGARAARQEAEEDRRVRAIARRRANEAAQRRANQEAMAIRQSWRR